MADDWPAEGLTKIPIAMISRERASSFIRLPRWKVSLLAYNFVKYTSYMLFLTTFKISPSRVQRDLTYYGTSRTRAEFVKHPLWSRPVRWLLITTRMKINWSFGMRIFIFWWHKIKTGRERFLCQNLSRFQKPVSSFCGFRSNRINFRRLATDNGSQYALSTHSYVWDRPRGNPVSQKLLRSYKVATTSISLILRPPTNSHHPMGSA